jgi:hypothetical protein
LDSGLGSESLRVRSCNAGPVAGGQILRERLRFITDALHSSSTLGRFLPPVGLGTGKALRIFTKKQ